MKKQDIWFMNTPGKEILKNIFSVVAGVLVSAALYMLFGLILLLFIASKAICISLSFSDATQGVDFIFSSRYIKIK